MFRRWFVSLIIVCVASTLLVAQDSLSVRHNPPLLHRLSSEVRPEYIFPTNAFLKGVNKMNKPIDFATSIHLTYGFEFAANSLMGRIYGTPYQGAGVAYYSFYDKSELGNPTVFYLFQGSRLAQLHEMVSLHLEWNFGLSCGWVPYNEVTNSLNGGVGSKRNAYLNLGVYLKWNVSPYIDIITGASLTHFSNGNTKYPNAGVNTGGGRLGVIFYPNRNEIKSDNSVQQAAIPHFEQHVSYDLLLFGSWRRRGVKLDDKHFAAPGSYPVAGFNFMPMYNFSYRFRAGLSLDGVYDGSGNIYTEDYIVPMGEKDPGYDFFKPALRKQFALGLSARAEYVMPYFTIGVGLGSNFLYGHGDMRGFYQILTLKTALTQRLYLNVGYKLHNFNTPSYLMLGLGFRFNGRSAFIK